MRINSKEHRVCLAKQLKTIRAYEKAKGIESYLKWLKSEKQIKKRIQCQMRNFVRTIDTEMLAIGVVVDA